MSALLLTATVVSVLGLGIWLGPWLFRLARSFLVVMKRDNGAAQIGRVERDDPELPGDVREHLEAAEARLAGAGLRPLGWSRLAGVPVLQIFNAVAGDDESTIGVGGVLRARCGPGRPTVSSQIEFVTWFGAGETLHTNNGAQQLPPTPGMLVMQYPECRDTASLLRIHRALVAASGRAPLAAPRDFDELLAASEADDAAREGAPAPDLAAFRALKRDRAGRIVAWDEQARRALAEVGLEELWRTPAR